MYITVSDTSLEELRSASFRFIKATATWEGLEFVDIKSFFKFQMITWKEVFLLQF